MIRSVVAGAVGGVVGSLAASAATPQSSPLSKGGLGYLGVFDADVVLFSAKRDAFKPKPTSTVIAAASRNSVRTASITQGAIGGVLEVSFLDGSTWQFEIARVNLSGARRVADALAMQR
jgi:hypothetical protein